MTFEEILLPNGLKAHIPADIQVIVPQPNEFPDVAIEHLQSLTHIPWDDTYLGLVPEAYRTFYQSILPKLRARSTDVHTALSVSHVKELVSLSGLPVDERILTIAVLLHDIGWAQLTPAQIALSLNYSAFTYTEEALVPKRLHASIGSEVAREVLGEKDVDLDLSDEDKAFIVKLVRYHDQIDPWPEKPEPAEYLLLGDADRLWSYTHENFWLDTIRKNTSPREYVNNIASAINNYFLTDAGRDIAWRLVKERQSEVDILESNS